MTEPKLRTLNSIIKFSKSAKLSWASIHFALPKLMSIPLICLTEERNSNNSEILSEYSSNIALGSLLETMPSIKALNDSIMTFCRREPTVIAGCLFANKAF